MMSDPCICSVIIETRTQEENALLRKVYSPFLAWIDPSFKLIKLLKQPQGYKTPNKWTQHRHDQIICSPDVMISPALSIMLFLHDTGPLSSKCFQKYFASSPWKLHHRVELVNIQSPNLALADQKFYQAESDTPLWAVCPVEQGHEHLRFNIFVRNFPAMVEFYRVVTGVEMETTKHNFCWFQLYSQPGVKIRLGLKYHKSIIPVPLQRSGLRFKIKNINNIRDVIGSKIRMTARGCFVVADPDGNTIYLDSGQTHLSILTTPCSLLRSTEKVWDGLFEEHYKNKCNKKTSDSSDSGRFSDSETCTSEYKFIRQNAIFAATSFRPFDVNEKGKLFSIHASNFKNLPPAQPDLTFEEKTTRTLKNSNNSMIVNVTETSNCQSQTFRQVNDVEVHEYFKTKSDKQKTISREGDFSGSQGKGVLLNVETIENAPSLHDFKNNTCFPANPFQFCSLGLPLKCDKETIDDGFYDETLSLKTKSVLGDSLTRGKNKNFLFSDDNDTRTTSFAEKNSSKEIIMAGTIAIDIAEVSNEIFV